MTPHSAASLVCAGCGVSIDPRVLSCAGCGTLTRAAELEVLAARAREATARGDLAAARQFWLEALPLLPEETVQYQTIQAHIANLDAGISAAAAQPHGSRWSKGGAAGIGSIALLLLSKGKMLLFGLTKLSTLVSMFASVGVYWALYGWAFAFGIVFSIYIHEMGHVLTLRHYGIPASAPMFIPGLGAYIRLKQLRITAIQDARVGLAGPLYGLGAAAAALLFYWSTGSKAWSAIAHFGAVINLFNLIPVWQLDGARGFHSLARGQRTTVALTAGGLWWISSEPMLLLIALVSVFRLFTKDAPEEPDATGQMHFIGLIAALTAVSVLAQFAVH